MRVGFGEAGAGIIGRNLSMVEGTDATMNLLGNRRKIDAIFGFCDVRQFTDTTECLQVGAQFTNFQMSNSLTFKCRNPQLPGGGHAVRES